MPTHHPRLSTLINASAIPGDFKQFEALIQGGIKSILGDLRYTNYIVEHSPDGDTAFYSLILLSKELDVPFFDPDMRLVFFKGEVAGYANFPISVDWRWPIQRYIRGFETQGFSYTPKAFLEILLSMADIEDTEELVEQIIAVFLEDGTDAYLDVLDEISSTFSNLQNNWSSNTNVSAHLHTIVSEIGNIKSEVQALLTGGNSLIQIAQNYQSNPAFVNIQISVDNIVAAYEAIEQVVDLDIDIYETFLEAAIADLNGLDEALPRLLELFSTWLGNITREDIEDLLVPQFGLELHEINMAIEFPRKWVLPMKEISQGGSKVWQIDDSLKPNGLELVQAAITFIAGAVKYHTTTGFEIDILKSNQIDLPRCLIPKLEIQLELLKIKLDLSRRKNIAEAVEDDRPEDFIGAYVAEANIFLPDKWFEFDPDGSTLKLFAADLLVGTGGVSGILGIEAVPGLNAKLKQDMDLEEKDGNGNHRKVNIDPKSGTNPDNDDSIIDIGDIVTENGTALGKGRYVLKDGGALLIGHGGKLEKFAPSDGSLSYKLGKKGSNKKWELGFNRFHMKLRQNALMESEVAGFLKIPNVKRYFPDSSPPKFAAEELQVNVNVHFERNGNFELTATPDSDLCFGVQKVFFICVDRLSVGKDEDKVYLELAGRIDFSINKLLSRYLKEPIEIKKLRIYSDGSFEFEGGSIPLPGSVGMKLGPVEVNITNLTMGSEDINPSYKFIGFDCGVSTGGGGMDLRGDGIKLYFSPDGSEMFLRIQGIAVDMMIPGTATEETAALLLKGYLSLKEAEYTGSVAFSLPKAKISGGAAMKMRPKDPSFLVDAFVEMPTPIPLGPTGLGIYGFRGLFGLRYVPELLEGESISDPKEMFKYYKRKADNPLTEDKDLGIHLGKLHHPEDTADATTPITIGAGVSLGTSADDGNAFSMLAFLFISIPEMLMINGKANVMADRLKFGGSEEPPFFASLMLTKEFISIGMGADYQLPKEDNTGDILEMQAEAIMAFFFKDPSAWYVHLGTKKEPNRARLIKKVFDLNAYAYLMLSANGIQAGAGIRFFKEQKFGPAFVSIKAYIDAYGAVSFRKPQIGGGIAMGGSVNVLVFGIGIYVGLDAYLMMTAPKPFIVQGGLEVCVSVKALVFKFERCLNLDFVWIFDRSQNLSPIGALPSPVEYNAIAGHHLGSGLPYALDSYVSTLPVSRSGLKVVPLDTVLDIQFRKPVDPQHLNNIGGFTNGPVNHTEKVSPKVVGGKQVKHTFTIDEVDLMILEEGSGVWKTYNPFLALDATSFLDPSVNPSILNIGSWQKKGKEYNHLRIMATQPFAYMDSMAGQIIPEQMGVTAATLFCEDKTISKHCIRWGRGDRLRERGWTAHEGALFRVSPDPSLVYPFRNVFGIPLSLSFDNHSKLEVLFPEPIGECCLKLFTFVDHLEVEYYSLEPQIGEVVEDGGTGPGIVGVPQYVLVQRKVVSWLDCVEELRYANASRPIQKIIIHIPCEEKEEQQLLDQQVQNLELQRLARGEDKRTSKVLEEEIVEIQEEQQALEDRCCPALDIEERQAEIHEEIQRLEDRKASIMLRKKLKEDKLNQREEEYQELLSLRDRCLSQHSASHSRKRKHCYTSKQSLDLLAELKALEEEFNERQQDLTEKQSKILQELDQQIERSKTRAQQQKESMQNMDQVCQDLEKQISRLNELLEILAQSVKVRTCLTYVHELCYLTTEEIAFNVSIPSQAAIDGDYSAMFDANNKVIAPILRPHSVFAIKVKTTERINTTNHRQTVYFPFATEGPLGHFDLKHLGDSLKEQYNLDSNGQEKPGRYDDFDKRVELPENSLKFYLDADRCYPHPLGNILNQKQMYYEDPQIRLFFREGYVKHFFGYWPAYQGLAERDSFLEIVIKDPTENSAADPPSSDPANPSAPVISQFPQSTVSWEQDMNPLTPTSLELLNDLRDPTRKQTSYNGSPCWQIGGDPIQPFVKQPVIKVEHLLPSKLYNAVVFNSYSQDMNTYERAQVHSFPFQTSRYPNLDAHISSYHQENEEGDQKDAIFDIETNVSRKSLLQIAMGSDEAFPVDLDQTLVEAYADPYQRIIDGLLELNNHPEPVCTEFNLLKQPTGEIIGIWMRTLEPINDPRIPYSEMYQSIEVEIDGIRFSSVKKDIELLQASGFGDVEQMLDTIVGPNGSAWVGLVQYCAVVHSKDRSAALILPLAPPIDPSATLKVDCSYLIWDGHAYQLSQSYLTDNLL